MRAWRRGAIAAQMVGLLALVPATGRATPNFPPFIQEYWELGFTPPCTLCHTSPTGGLGTANTPFGTYMRSRGLVAFDTQSLQTALDADRAEHHDSSGDGLGDYDELRSGKDPTLSGGVGSGSIPEYGFSCTTAPAGDGGTGRAWWLGSGLGVVLWSFGRRRRSGPRSRLDG